MKTSPESVERMMHVYCGSQNIKVKIQEADMDKVCNASRELFASKSKEVFDEFHTLKRNLAYRFQSSWNFINFLYELFAGCSTLIGQLFSAYSLQLSWQTREKAFAVRWNFVEYLIICVSYTKCALIAIDDKKSFSDEEMKSYPQLKRFTDICDSQSSLGLGMENYDMFSRWLFTYFSFPTSVQAVFTLIFFLAAPGPSHWMMSFSLKKLWKNLERYIHCTS